GSDDRRHALECDKSHPVTTPRRSALGTRPSAPSTRHSPLNTRSRHSAVSTRHSALSTRHSALGTRHSALVSESELFEPPPDDVLAFTFNTSTSFEGDHLDGAVH